MSKKQTASPAPAQGRSGEEPPSPTIHEAELASGPSGAVIRGAEIDFDTAVARRQAGSDVVVWRQQECEPHSGPTD